MKLPRIRLTPEQRESVEAEARRLCVKAGHDPDAIGAAPSNNGSAIPSHAFPRWMDWQDEAMKNLGFTE